MWQSLRGEGAISMRELWKGVLQAVPIQVTEISGVTVYL